MATFQSSLINGLFSGVVKVILEAQVPIKDKAVNNKFCSIESSPMSYCYENNKSNRYQLIDLYSTDPKRYVVYSIRHLLWFYGYSQLQPIDTQFFKPPEKLTKDNPLSWLMMKPFS